MNIYVKIRVFELYMMSNQGALKIAYWGNLSEPTLTCSEVWLYIYDYIEVVMHKSKWCALSMWYRFRVGEHKALSKAMLKWVVILYNSQKR